MKEDVKLELFKILLQENNNNKSAENNFQNKSFKLANDSIGKFVIIRSYSEGVNAGTLKSADETGVILINCRRLYYHEPKDKTMSWYEGVAKSGLSNNSKVSVTCDKKIIVEKYSITECTDTAKDSIMSLIPNSQN